MGRRKPKIIHEWKKPKEVSIHEMKELFRQGKAAAPRILIFTATLLLVLHHFLRSVLPEDFGASFSKAFIGVFVYAVALVCFVYLIHPLIIRYSRCTYKITEDGVKVISVGQYRVLSWTKIRGYVLATHDHVPEIPVLTIHAPGTIRHLYLPEGELAQQIINLVAGKIPQIEQIPDSFKKIQLSKYQFCYLLLFTVVYSVVVAYCLFDWLFRYRQPSIMLLLFGIILLGPGTLGLLALFGRRFLKNKYLKAYALALNMIAIGLTVLLNMLLLLNYFSKQIS